MIFLQFYMRAATSEVDDAHRQTHCMDNFRLANENMWEDVAAILGKQGDYEAQ